MRLTSLSNCFLGLSCILAINASIANEPSQVVTRRVPHGGIQPQVAVADDGTVHLIYYLGDAAAGDVYYCRMDASASEFSEPIRVNSQAGSAIAAGTIRGAHIALGRDGRVHVAWNGSGKATPRGPANPDLPEESPYRLSSPMLYARMASSGTSFEPQRNLMTHTYALDGGGSVAADPDGNVYVVWHANSTTSELRGEEGRAVWIAASHDDGETFATEARANREDTGACGCCALRAYANEWGRLFVLYRSAQESVNRDMHVLDSQDQGKTFTSRLLDRWEVPQCVMSSAAVSVVGGAPFGAWETEEQVRFGRLDDRTAARQVSPFSPNVRSNSCKHPVLAANTKGQFMLAWTEGTGWRKGGALAWQIFDRLGNAVADSSGRIDGVPVWSFAAAFANRDGGFTIVY